MTLIVLLRLTRTGTSRYSGKRVSLTRLHDRELLLQPHLPAAVLLGEALHQPLVKGVHTGKFPTAPRLQALIQIAFERPVLRLDRAVLLLLAYRRGPGFHPKMRHQLEVFGQKRSPPSRDLVRRPTRIIGLVPLRYTPQPKDRFLHALLQRQQRLRLTTAGPLPIRIRQHKMTQQRGKGLALQGHRQTLGMGEVGLSRLARPMLLGEKDFMALVCPMECPPLGYMPVQRPLLPGSKPPWITLLQILKQKTDPYPRLLPQPRLDLRPHFRKRIFPRLPLMGPLQLRG